MVTIWAKNAIFSLFANYPELRVYFKGAENFSNEIQQSDRFQHQGQQILLDCNTLANTFDDQIKFKTYARETVHRHMTNVDPSLWSVGKLLLIKLYIFRSFSLFLSVFLVLK